MQDEEGAYEENMNRLLEYLDIAWGIFISIVCWPFRFWDKMFKEKE